MINSDILWIWLTYVMDTSPLCWTIGFLCLVVRKSKFLHNILILMIFKDNGGFRISWSVSIWGRSSTSLLSGWKIQLSVGWIITFWCQLFNSLGFMSLFYCSSNQFKFWQKMRYNAKNNDLRFYLTIWALHFLWLYQDNKMFKL